MSSLAGYQPKSLDDVPAGLSEIGWRHVATVFVEMQEALAEYARAHDRFTAGREEPFASVSEASRLQAMRQGAAVMKRERVAEEGA